MPFIHIDSRLAARLAEDAVAITRAGRYTTPGGRVVEIAADVERAVAGTRSYRRAVKPSPAASPPARPAGTRISVANETTLDACRRLDAAGRDAAALNFASARNPGGGFLKGARAQEESLCRASSLFACLEGNEMYTYHRAHDDALYAPWVLYSPAVPVFRDDDGPLLEAPYLVAFLTCAAPNAKVVLERDASREPEIASALVERARILLSVAAAHGHDALVLGAWGCGVFGNDPVEVAQVFGAALDGEFRGCFAEVVFAIVDQTPDQRTIGPFQRRFGAGSGS